MLGFPFHSQNFNSGIIDRLSEPLYGPETAGSITGDCPIVIEPNVKANAVESEKWPAYLNRFGYCRAADAFSKVRFRRQEDSKPNDTRLVWLPWRADPGRAKESSYATKPVRHEATRRARNAWTARIAENAPVTPRT